MEHEIQNWQELHSIGDVPGRTIKDTDDNREGTREDQLKIKLIWQSFTDKPV